MIFNPRESTIDMDKWPLLILGLIVIGGGFFIFLQFNQKSADINESGMIQFPEHNLGGSIRIEYFNSSSVTIRNVGLEEVQNSGLNVYINNVIQNCNWLGSFPFKTDEIITCDFMTKCETKQIIKVSSPWNFDQVEC